MELKEVSKKDFDKVYGLLTVILGNKDIARERADHLMKSCEFKYTVEDDGIVIGFLAGKSRGKIDYSKARVPAWIIEKFAEIVFLGIHPNYKNKGIESKLLKNIEEAVKEIKNGVWAICDERQRSIFKRNKYVELSSFAENEKKMYVMAKCWKEQREFKRNIRTRQKKQVTKLFSK